MASKELKLRVAQLSFVEGKNNKEIAAILRPEKPITNKTNLSWVQNLIEETGQWLMQREERLTEMEHEVTLERKLAADLRGKFGLIDARVVPGGEIREPYEYVPLMRSYGRAAADYFDEVASDAETHDKQLHVAVSGGQPILDMVSSLTDRKRTNVYFYAAALIGRGKMTHAPHVGSEANATVAWSRSGRLPGHLHYGTVPPYDMPEGDPKALDRRQRHNYAGEELIKQKVRIRSTHAVQGVLKDMNAEINMAFAGLGVPYAEGADAGHIERLTMTELLRPFGIDPKLLVEDKAVGDMSYCLFDEKGNGREEWKYFITTGECSKHEGVEFYRNMVRKSQKVIVIAGVRKEAAIRPALNAKLFNVLITDAVTAKRLL